MALITERPIDVTRCPLCRGERGTHIIGCIRVPLDAVKPEIDAAEACLHNGTTREAVSHLLEAVRRLNARQGMS